MLRRLDDADVGFAHQRGCARQEIGQGHEVGVQDGDEFGLRLQPREGGQGGVDIAGLGVRIVGAREIAGAELRAELAQPGAARVVADPDAGGGIICSERADDRAFEHVAILVIGADQHVDLRPLFGRQQPGKVALDLGRTVAGAREKAHRRRRADHVERLDKRERHARREIERAIESGDGVGPAPEFIAPHEEQAQADRADPHQRMIAIDRRQDRRRQRDDEEPRQEGGEIGRVHGLACADVSKVTSPERPTRHSAPRARSGNFSETW